MNTFKKPHYKSAVQFYNATPQPIATTSLIANPVSMLLGNKVTDTGVAIDLMSNGVSVETTGLYRISADVNLVGTVAGDLTFALALNGEILPETIRTITAVAGASIVVPMETVRRLHTCYNFDEYSISVIAYSDGTGTGTVNRVSGNVVKQA